MVVHWIPRSGDEVVDDLAVYVGEAEIAKGPDYSTI
jgi:hypothetical protein